MTAAYDHRITDLAHALYQRALEYRQVIEVIDREAPALVTYDHTDELRTYDAKCEAEQALYDAIEKAGAAMTERRRSTLTYAANAFVDGVDASGKRFGDFRPVTVVAPFDEAHLARGERLRRARIDAGLGLRDLHGLPVGLPDDFTFATLSQVEHGTTEATEDEWSALWAALGREEPL